MVVEAAAGRLKVGPLELEAPPVSGTWTKSGAVSIVGGAVLSGSVSIAAVAVGGVALAGRLRIVAADVVEEVFCFLVGVSPNIPTFSI